MLADWRSRFGASQVLLVSKAIIREAERPFRPPPPSFAPTQPPRSWTVGPSLASQTTASPPHTPPEVPADIPEEYMTPEPSHGKHEMTSNYGGMYADVRGFQNNPFNGTPSHSPESLGSKTTENPPTATNRGSFGQLPSPILTSAPAAQGEMSGFYGVGQSLPFRSNTNQHTERQASNRPSQGYSEDDGDHDTQRTGHYNSASISSDPVAESRPTMPTYTHSTENNKVQQSNTRSTQAHVDGARVMPSDLMVTAPLRKQKESDRGPPPSLSIAALRRWAEEMKTYKSSSILKNDNLLNQLRKRDHVSKDPDVVVMSLNMRQ